MIAKDVINMEELTQTIKSLFLVMEEIIEKYIVWQGLSSNRIIMSNCQDIASIFTVSDLIINSEFSFFISSDYI